MALNSVVSRLDFGGKIEDIETQQKEAIITIRSCLNIISFAKGVDRERIGRTDDLGLLAVNGQGQCHGLSSTMSGYLYPFASLLGIDMQYRGGSSFTNGDGVISSSVEKHQWLQLTLRPAMSSYVCDLWYEDSLEDQSYLCMNIEQSMVSVSCPHNKLLLQNTLKEIALSDIVS